jgi:hypothetical protein
MKQSRFNKKTVTFYFSQAVRIPAYAGSMMNVYI